MEYEDDKKTNLKVNIKQNKHVAKNIFLFDIFVSFKVGQKKRKILNQKYKVFNYKEGDLYSTSTVQYISRERTNADQHKIYNFFRS